MKIASYASKSTADSEESRQHLFLSSTSYRSIFSTASPPSDLIRSDQTKVPSAFLSTTGLIQINISIADFSKSTRISSASRSTIDSYRSTSDFFSAEITSRRQHHMKIFDDFHIEEYFHRFFSS